MTRTVGLLVGLAVVGCASEGGNTSGRALFEQPVSGGNTFACATCHALSEPAVDGFLRPGHPIGNATRRPSFKNGQLTDVLDAVNVCRTEWMTAPAWGDSDKDWIALRDFLDSQATVQEAPAVSFQIASPPTDVSGGDAVAGLALFDSSCAICHGAGAAGTERAPPLVGPLLSGGDYIATRIRTSGVRDSSVYPGLTGGRMPFWSRDRLSDDQVRDLTAFVLSNDPDPPPGPDAGVPADAGMSTCASTHALVGKTATLAPLFHGVGGTATVIDDCTIEISMFSYDGTGIDVRVYGGLGGNYSQGFAMTEDLLRVGGYQNATLIAKVPEGKSLDDLDGISIWCVAVAQSFGDGMF